MTDSATPQPASGSLPVSRAPVSRRHALAVGGGLAAAVAAGSVAAGAPAAAAATAGTASPETLLSISLEQAKAVLRAAEREARRQRIPAYIVVVDVCGDVKAASRQDGNSPASLTLAPLKAQTALAFRTPTATLAERTTDPVRAQSFLAAGFTLLGGGLPITVDGQVIGAIGVGGGSPDDDVEIAEAGLAALAD
jgi:glc operon protein GlcG